MSVGSRLCPSTGRRPWRSTRGGPRGNTWQGAFPYANSREDGYVRTSPVGTYPSNDCGLHDMSGNVWEWCADWYAVDRHRRGLGAAGPEAPFHPAAPWEAQRVVKGGSFLCHDAYCSGYRPSARRGTSPDTGMSHLGFRCVRR